MKWAVNFFILGLVLVLGFAVPVKKSPLIADLKIKEMLDSLPSNWYGKYTDTLITFYCKDSVYRIWTNHINEDVHMAREEPGEEEKMENFRQAGKKKEVAFLSFRLEKKWTDSQIKKVNATNQKIYKQIKALPKKHRIDHLYDNYASHKGTPTYRGKTEDDAKRIAAYEAEKAMLEKRVIKFPEYCTFHYSIFSSARVGMNGAFEDVYPEKVSQQAYHIINKVSEIWDCNVK